MVHIPQYLSNVLHRAVLKAYPAHSALSFSLSSSSLGTHDYQSNAAFLLGNSLRLPPHLVASALQDHASKDLDGVATLESSSGFLNFRLCDDWLRRCVSGTHSAPLTFPNPRTGQSKVLVDFASPNVGKELHVGHLRSAVIGDTLARVFEYVGKSPVARVSHVGDCGLPVALVMHAYMDKLHTFEGKLPSPSQLSDLYVNSKAATKKDTQVAAAVALTLRTLQRELAGTCPASSLTEIWGQLCAASRAGYEPLFEALHVRVEERGESSYLPSVASLVAELEERGVAEMDDGALVIRLGGGQEENPRQKGEKKGHSHLPPVLIRKGDGAYLYATTDLACLRWRLSQGFERILYVTDAAQSLHFAQLFAAAERAGWVDGSVHPARNNLFPGRPPVSLLHAPFGVVRGEGSGKKLSSRDGVDVTSLKALLQAGCEYALKIMEEGGGGGGGGGGGDTATTAGPPHAATMTSLVVASNAAKNVFSPAQRFSQASRVAHSVIRFFDLAHRRNASYTFSMKSAFSVKGNSAAYPLYALARLRGIRESACRFLQLRSSGGEEFGVDGSGGGMGAVTWDVICEGMRARKQQLEQPPPSSSSSSSHQATLSPATFYTYTTPQERSLALSVLAFHEATTSVMETLDPHSLTEYTLRLATAFHSFYSSVKVLPDASSSASDWELTLHRVELCRAAEGSLKTALDLCGVDFEVDRL